MSNHSKAVETATPERHLKAHRPTKEAVVNADKELARKLREASARKARLASATVGLYSLKVKDGNYGIPYAAVNDHFALLASKQLLPTADCYCIGSFCLIDGKSTSCRPRLVLDNKVV